MCYTIPMLLPDYITKLGDEAFADLVGIKGRTAASWRRRERFPRAMKAREIVKLTRGEVSFAEVYAPSKEERA